MNIVPTNGNYERFDRDGLELIVNTDTGMAYASVSAVARMLKISKSTASEAFGNHETTKAEIHTQQGSRTVRAVSADVVFDLAFTYNPQLAKAMGTAGANLYLLGLAGYRAKIEAKPKTALELAKEQVKLLEQIELQAAQIEILEQETERQAEIIDELFDYSSIVRIAKYNGCDEKAFSWRKLKAASNVLGLEVKQAPCPIFGTRNLYSHDAWRFAYPGYRVPETLTLTIGDSVNQQLIDK